MEVWHLLLYSAASFLALKSLASLMTHHRQTVYRQMLLEEYARSQQQQAEQKRAEREAQSQPQAGAAA